MSELHLGSGRQVRIGIVVGTERGRFGEWDVPTAMLPRSYVDLIEEAGALPVLFPASDAITREPALVLDLVDGLLLAGGRDLGAALYDAERHPRTDPSDPTRDRAELAVARLAIERDVPVLGICRGMQLLNVLRGGTLEQHLPDVVGHEEHSSSAGSFRRHEVAIVAGSLLADCYAQSSAVGVHTAHHQAVARLGDGLVATAYSVPDVVVEAVELPGREFVLGVQWHPEQDESTPVIPALVEHARRRLS